MATGLRRQIAIIILNNLLSGDTPAGGDTEGRTDTSRQVYVYRSHGKEQ